MCHPELAILYLTWSTLLAEHTSKQSIIVLCLCTIMHKQSIKVQKRIQRHATPENRTPPNCLEGNYANHYTSAAGIRMI